MIGVYWLCGELPVTFHELSALIPAAWAPLLSTFDVLTTDGESLASTKEPWRSPLFCFSRYFESPLLVR